MKHNFIVACRYSKLPLEACMKQCLIILPYVNRVIINFEMEHLTMQDTIRPSHPASLPSDDIDDLEEIELQYQNRRQFRQHKVATIRHHLQSGSGGKEHRQRKSQSLLLYLLNLCIPIVLTCLNAYILLDLGVNSELKGKLIIAFVFSGFTISIISNLQIAPWHEVIKLYFVLDSLIPVLVAGLIGFFSVFNYLSTGQWYQRGFQACFPVFVFYYGGSLRVMIAYERWQRWKVILYKLAVLSCGLIFFYVGFTYMNGAYKITKGYLPQVEDTVKNVIYLYVFGNVDLFFEYYRRISEFDQTNDLKYEYQFRSEDEVQRERIIGAQLKKVEEEVMEEELQDRLAMRVLTLKRIESKQSVNKEDIIVELPQ